MQDAFEAMGAAAKDQAVKDDVRHVGQSLTVALGATFSEISEELRKRARRPGDEPPGGDGAEPPSGETGGQSGEQSGEQSGGQSGEQSGEQSGGQSEGQTEGLAHPASPGHPGRTATRPGWSRGGRPEPVGAGHCERLTVGN